MKKLTLLLCLIICAIASSCNSSKTTISKSADLDKYNYACITEIECFKGHVKIMDADVLVYDAINDSRLQMVGDRFIDQLTPEQQQQLLLVRCNIFQNDESAIASIHFTDFVTGQPIVSFTSDYGTGMNSNGDLNGTIKKIRELILKTFPK